MSKQLILGLKNFLLPFSVAPFILHLKHSNRAFEALLWLQKATIPDAILGTALCTALNKMKRALQLKQKLLFLGIYVEK